MAIASWKRNIALYVKSAFVGKIEISQGSVELKKFLYGLLNNVDGLHGISITDTDGVPLVCVANKEVPEFAIIKDNFSSVFTVAIDQGSKLGLGKNKIIMCIYHNYQVIQMNKLPLVITFIASNNCNIGQILSLESKIDPVLNILKDIVKQT